MNIALRIAQFLFLLFLIRIVVHMISNRFRRRDPRTVRKAFERSRGALVRDPQCGTYVPVDGAITSGRGADTEHFCSTTCRDAWLRAREARRRA